MTATATTGTKRARERGAARLEREIGAYLAFYAELYPAPMLAEYPAAEDVQARRANVARIAGYGRRFPRR